MGGVGEGVGAGRGKVGGGEGEGAGKGKVGDGLERVEGEGKGVKIPYVPPSPGSRSANLRLPCWSGRAHFELLPVLPDYFLRGRQGASQHLPEDCPLGAGQSLDQLFHFRFITLID